MVGVGVGVSLSGSDMDEFNSLISLQDHDDDDDSSYPFHHQHIIPTVPLYQQTIEQDLVVIPADNTPLLLTTTSNTHPAILEKNDLINNVQHKKGRKQRKSSAVGEEDGNNIIGSDPNQKRIVHRDIERQRRQEMASLYSSLRTLLPLEYIRGKRSICDQVNEAVNYIKYQEKNIKQLQSKRDKLRTFLEANSSNDQPDMSMNEAAGKSTKYYSSSSCSPIEISIRPCSQGGIEILISNELVMVGDEPLLCPLSTVLKVLVEVGLTVVSCFCAKVKDKFLYTIQTEVTDNNTDFHIRVLPRKLSEKIKAPINIKCCSTS